MMTRLLLSGAFLLAVVIVLAIIDLNVHFHPLVVVALMLIATYLVARFLSAPGA